LLFSYLKCNFLQEAFFPSFFKVYYEPRKEKQTLGARQIFDGILRRKEEERDLVWVSEAVCSTPLRVSELM
jgi:hypothetical protein